MSAQEALQWGLINRVVPKGQALAEARRMAEELCENAPLSVQAILRSLRENQFHLAEADALKREEELGWPIFATQDAREGMKAFKEKRKPNYIGK